MADPVTLAFAAAAASTVISAGGAYEEGVQAKNSADYKAKQLEVNAGQQRAMGQRQAIEARRQGRLAESKLQANAAASGAGASDPTVVGLAQDIGAESEYNALTQLYNAEEQARGMEGEGSLLRYEGRMAKRAGTRKAITTLLSPSNYMSGSTAGGSGSVSKYGGSGPNYNTSTGSMGSSTSYYPKSNTTVYWN